MGEEFSYCEFNLSSISLSEDSTKIVIPFKEIIYQIPRMQAYDLLVEEFVDFIAQGPEERELAVKTTEISGDKFVSLVSQNGAPNGLYDILITTKKRGVNGLEVIFSTNPCSNENTRRGLGEFYLWLRASSLLPMKD